MFRKLIEYDKLGPKNQLERDKINKRRAAIKMLNGVLREKQNLQKIVMWFMD